MSGEYNKCVKHCLDCMCQDAYFQLTKEILEEYETEKKTLKKLENKLEKSVHKCIVI